MDDGDNVSMLMDSYAQVERVSIEADAARLLAVAGQVITPSVEKDQRSGATKAGAALSASENATSVPRSHPVQSSGDTGGKSLQSTSQSLVSRPDAVDASSTHQNKPDEFIRSHPQGSVSHTQPVSETQVEASSLRPCQHGALPSSARASRSSPLPQAAGGAVAQPPTATVEIGIPAPILDIVHKTILKVRLAGRGGSRILRLHDCLSTPFFGSIVNAWTLCRYNVMRIQMEYLWLAPSHPARMTIFETSQDFMAMRQTVIADLFSIPRVGDVEHTIGMLLYLNTPVSNAALGTGSIAVLKAPGTNAATKTVSDSAPNAAPNSRIG
ncbi:MAG: hypothetical protein Q9217_004425 [Psora testacea]